MTENLPASQDDSRHAQIVEALADLNEGKSLREIAEHRGIPYATLRVWLLSDVPEKYRTAQEQALIARIADSDEILEGANSHLAVARADRVCKYARWDAERRLKRLFAPSQEMTGPGGGPIQLDGLERARRVSFLRSLDAIDVDVVQRSTEGDDLTSAAGSDHNP